jgi:type IV pilus assembly protein PilA
MKNGTQGFTLIELLIVIAIIGILAAVLIPNLLGAQKRAYDTGAQACAKSLQTYLAVQQIDNQTYPSTLPSTGDGINSNCALGTTTVAGYSGGVSSYRFTVKDTRGSKIYTVTPSSISGVAQ